MNMAGYGMFTDKSNIIAVVGVSQDADKYSYKVYKALKKQGFTIFGVNPKYAQIGDDKIYPNLMSLPQLPTLVITVTPRAVTLQIVQEAKELGVPRVWMQPGSESDEAVNFCKRTGMQCTYKACFVMDGLGADFD